MAARSGAGTGVVVGLVVFVLSTVFLLVLTIVFYSQKEAAVQQRAEAMDSLRDFVTPVEQNNDSIKAVVSESGGSSVVQHLLDERGRIMLKVAGNRGADFAELESRLQQINPSNPPATYAEAISMLQSQVRAAQTEASSASERASTFQQERDEQMQLLEDTRAANQKEVEAVRESIDTFVKDVQAYGLDVAEAKAAMQESVNLMEKNFNERVDILERSLDNTRADLAIASQQRDELREVLDVFRQQSQTPDLLVDGNILDAPDGRGQVFINRGKNDHITVGMTFEVYDDASMLAADQFGNIPRGKASLQVIKVGETASTATITRSSPNRPVVRDDVIANAIYDPDKVFSFLVHGKFDVNGDGRPSEWEADEIRKMVTNWGGEIVEGDELRGDLDFLLLGTQPNEPPPLRDNPTPAEVEIWVQQKSAVEKYNTLLRDASNASIPVLNQNRFFVLIGHTYQ